MPRPGPRRPLVAFKLDQQAVERIDQRAQVEAGGVRSEMIRRMVAYAAQHMPAGWNTQGEQPESAPPAGTP